MIAYIFAFLLNLTPILPTNLCIQYGCAIGFIICEATQLCTRYCITVWCTYTPTYNILYHSIIHLYLCLHIYSSVQNMVQQYFTVLKRTTLAESANNVHYNSVVQIIVSCSILQYAQYSMIFTKNYDLTSCT